MLSASKSTDETLALRQKGGRWLKALRENAKLSQSDVAKALGIDYYTFISQLEAGRGRVPPAQYSAFAKAYNVPVKDFAKTLLSFYEPAIYSALFEDEEPEAELEQKIQNLKAVEEPSVSLLAERIARLEAKLHLNRQPRKR